VHRSLLFRRFHFHKCRNIRTADLILSAKMGLYQCVRNYNGNTSFYPYLRIYLEGALYKGMTEYFPITSIPKGERRKSKRIQLLANADWKERLLYRKKLNTHFLGFDNYWQLEKTPLMQQELCYYEKNSEDLEYLLQYQQWMNRLTSREQVLIQMKYDRDFTKLRSDREIAEEINLSEETVRKTIAGIRMKWWRTFLDDFSKKEYHVLNHNRMKEDTNVKNINSSLH
jgi:RNA polymerase sigma factor (sigma-70 family)